MGSRIFEEGYAVRKFLEEDNSRVVNWLRANWERFGMAGPVDKTIVSRALLGEPVREETVAALEGLVKEMREDPWAWCKPPERIEDLPDDHRPLTWWYDTLKPPLPEYRFKRIRTQLLPDDMRADVQRALDNWSSRLRAACDRFQADTRLVRAMHADIEPEFQHWVDDCGWRLVTPAEYRRASGTKMRRRVGDRGLQGCTAEEIGLAYALADAVRPLPLVKEARLAYAQPRGVPEHDHYSEPVEPWNGAEFEGFEVEDALIKPARYTGDMEERVKVRHRVCYWWDGQRYQVEDVRPFDQVLDGQWREPTQDERDLLETGMTRSLWTRQELEERRDQWINDVHAAQVAEGDSRTRKDVEQQFETVLARHNMQSDEAAADERREIARRRIEFKRSLRRR